MVSEPCGVDRYLSVYVLDNIRCINDLSVTRSEPQVIPVEHEGGGGWPFRLCQERQKDLVLSLASKRHQWICSSGAASGKVCGQNANQQEHEPGTSDDGGSLNGRPE